MRSVRASAARSLLCIAFAGLFFAGNASASPTPVSARWETAVATARHVSTDCASSRTVTCLTVTVPLDRSGRVPGTVALHGEMLPARDPRRGVLFLIAGGPGQASAESFDLARPDVASLYRYLFPGYTLVAIDNRGTGTSGRL